MVPARPISLEAACSRLTELWSPRVVAQVNDHLVKVARVHGEFPWHTHEHEDELFLVLSGALTIGREPQEGGPVTLQPGECFVVPRGFRHNTSAQVETLIALIEPAGTLHSGAEQTPLTRTLADQLRPIPDQPPSLAHQSHPLPDQLSPIPDPPRPISDTTPDAPR